MSKIKNPLVHKIIRVFERMNEQELTFDQLNEKLGDAPSAIAGVLSSYPGIFIKSHSIRALPFDEKGTVKQTVWRLVPNESVDEQQIREIYGLSDDSWSDLADSHGIRYLWIRAARSNDGKFNRRDVHKLMHRMRRDAGQPVLKSGSLSTT